MSNKTLLIVPCYNEATRLDLAAYKEYASDTVNFLFANDGSSDETTKVVSEIVDNEKIFLFDSARNFGKANIIFNAFEYFSKNYDVDKYDWVGYWDADLATPLYEVQNMLDITGEREVDAVWGARISRQGANIERSPLRHYLGRIFTTVVSVVLGVTIYDSQCGAKIFKTNIAKTAFSKEFGTKWVFDVEIYLRIKHAIVYEYPLNEWRDVPGSKVNISRDAFRVLRDIYYLWKNY